MVSCLEQVKTSCTQTFKILRGTWWETPCERHCVQHCGRHHEGHHERHHERHHEGLHEWHHEGHHEGQHEWHHEGHHDWHYEHTMIGTIIYIYTKHMVCYFNGEFCRHVSCTCAFTHRHAHSLYILTSSYVSFYMVLYLRMCGLSFQIHPAHACVFYIYI